MMSLLLSSVSASALLGGGSSWPTFATLTFEDSAINTTNTCSYVTTDLVFPAAGVYLLVIQGSFNPYVSPTIDLQSITDGTFSQLAQWGNTQYDAMGFWKVTVTSGGTKTITYRGDTTHYRSQIAIYTPNEAIDWDNYFIDAQWNATTVTVTMAMSVATEKGSIVGSYWNNTASPTHTGPSTVDIAPTLTSTGFYGSMRSQNNLPSTPDFDLTNSGGTASRTMIAAIVFGYLSEAAGQSVRVGSAKTYVVAGNSMNGITIAKQRQFVVVGNAQNGITMSHSKTYIVVDP